jgi:hypothetical protein
MPLPLDDDRWQTLKTAYHLPCDEVVDWLGTAYQSGMTDELLGDIINDVQHQGDTSEAMYAVAPHLVALAQDREDATAAHVIAMAGLIYASAAAKTAVPCPSDLKRDFEAAREEGKRITLKLLALNHNFDDFKYLVAALAGFSGHERFGRLIEGFDFFENQFDHPLIDGPFEDEP